MSTVKPTTFRSEAFGTVVGLLLAEGTATSLLLPRNAPELHLPSPRCETVSLAEGISHYGTAVDVYVEAGHPDADHLAEVEETTVHRLAEPTQRVAVSDGLICRPAGNRDESPDGSERSVGRRESIEVVPNPTDRDGYLRREYGVGPEHAR